MASDEPLLDPIGDNHNNNKHQLHPSHPHHHSGGRNQRKASSNFAINTSIQGDQAVYARSSFDDCKQPIGFDSEEQHHYQERHHQQGGGGVEGEEEGGEAEKGNDRGEGDQSYAIGRREQKRRYGGGDEEEEEEEEEEEDSVFEEKCLRAAALVEAGLLGRAIDRNALNPSMCMLYSKTNTLRTALLLLLLSVNVFEEPSWCGFDGDTSRCGVQGRNYQFFGFQMSNGHNRAAMSIDSICIFSLIIMAIIRLRAYGLQLWMLSRGLYVLLLLATLATSVVKTVTGSCALPSSILRPLVLVTGFDRLRSLTVSCLRVVPMVADILLFLFCFIAFAAVLAVFLFRDKVLVDSAEEAKEYFATFEDAFINLFILFTTANNPIIMIPAYTEARAFVIFFVVFIVISIFFLSNLILAQVYETYRVSVNEEAKEIKQNRRYALAQAYKVLKGSARYVARNHMHQTLAYLRSFKTIIFPRIPKIKGLDVGGMNELILSAMTSTNNYNNNNNNNNKANNNNNNKLRRNRQQDEKNHDDNHDYDDASTMIKWRDFVALPYVLSLSFKPKRDETITDDRISQWEQRRRYLSSVVLSWKYEACMCVLIVVEFLLVVVELERKGAPRDEYVAMEMTFSSLFFCEAIIIVYIVGTSRFFRSWRRRFQFVSSLLGLVIEAFVVAPTTYNDRNILRYVVLVRTIRAFFLLYEIPRFHKVFRKMWRLLEPFSAVIGLLAIFVAVFASVGVHAFGGLIWEHKKSIIDNAPDYVTSGYWVLNFNDFAGAYVLTFNLLVVNDWWVIMEGTVAAAGSHWARLYFILFYLLCVIIVLNIVVSVMLSIAKHGSETGGSEDHHHITNNDHDAWKRQPVCVFEMATDDREDKGDQDYYHHHHHDYHADDDDDDDGLLVQGADEGGDGRGSPVAFRDMKRSSSHDRDSTMGTDGKVRGAGQEQGVRVRGSSGTRRGRHQNKEYEDDAKNNRDTIGDFKVADPLFASLGIHTSSCVSGRGGSSSTSNRAISGGGGGGAKSGKSTHTAVSSGSGIGHRTSLGRKRRGTSTTSRTSWRAQILPSSNNNEGMLGSSELVGGREGAAFVRDLDGSGSRQQTQPGAFSSGRSVPQHVQQRVTSSSNRVTRANSTRAEEKDSSRRSYKVEAYRRTRTRSLTTVFDVIGGEVEEEEPHDDLEESIPATLKSSNNMLPAE